MSEEPKDHPPEDAPGRPPSDRRTVLDALSQLSGQVSRIHLRDNDSEHGSPIIGRPGDDGDAQPSGKGNYKILGEIARGGMGVVLRGHDSDLGRDVALKVLIGELAGKGHVVQRFVEEAQIGGQLQHPGIVPVYEMGMMDDGRPYFTMKLVKGRTLSELLANRSSVTEDRRRFLSIFESVCQTVAYAHAKDVIHRDLKPANVMVGAFGEVQVVDWGLAKVLRRGGIEDERRVRRGAQTFIETIRSGPGSAGSDSIVGSVMGTPAYMPPEQAMGDHERLDERADVFSLGAILCEILTGRPPYVSTEKDRTVVMAAHARLEPALERLADCDADEELKKLCTECLSLSPVARPRNAEEVARRIQKHLTEVEERARRAEIEIAEARIRARAERRSKRLTFGLAATIIGALIVFGLGYREVEMERLERLAGTQRALDDVQAQVLELQGQGLFDQALETARGGSLLVDSTEVEDAGLSERAHAIEAQALARVNEEEALSRRLRDETSFAARCEELRLQQIILLFEGRLLQERRAELDRGFEAAFRALGVDVQGDPTLALERLRDSTVAEDAALALDDWASLIRGIEGRNSLRAEALGWIAVDLDPDPLRSRLRRAVIAGDYGDLLELAESDELDEFPPATLARLHLELRNAGRIVTMPEISTRLIPTSQAMIQRAVEARPGDFMLNFLAGYALRGAAAVHHAMAARALRPDSPYTNALAGDAFNAVGQLPGAVESYTRAAELRPEFRIIHYLRSWFALHLGDFDTALAALEALRSLPDERDAAELLIATVRFGQGTATRDELEALLRSRRWEDGHGALAFLLATHPDPSRRDPARALELMRLVGPDSDGDIVVGIPAYCHLLLGDADAALAAVTDWEARISDQNLYGRVSMGYCRALAHHLRDETALAQIALSDAERGFRDLLTSNAEAWKDSWLVRQRGETLRAMGR